MNRLEKEKMETLIQIGVGFGIIGAALFIMVCLSVLWEKLTGE